MNSQTNRRLGIAMAAIGILSARPAMAIVPTDWNGATIGVQYLFPDTGSVDEDDGTVTVGPGVEGIYGDSVSFPIFNYDISGNQIEIVFTFLNESTWTSAPFNGPHFFDAGGDDLNLTGVSVNSGSNLPGLSNANLTWDGDNIFLNWQGLSFNSETQVILDLQFNGEQSVPEASTWAAGGALAAVVGGMWFRRRRA